MITGQESLEDCPKESPLSMPIQLLMRLESLSQWNQCMHGHSIWQPDIVTKQDVRLMASEDAMGSLQIVLALLHGYQGKACAMNEEVALTQLPIWWYLLQSQHSSVPDVMLTGAPSIRCPSHVIMYLL